MQSSKIDLAGGQEPSLLEALRREGQRGGLPSRKTGLARGRCWDCTTWLTATSQNEPLREPTLSSAPSSSSSSPHSHRATIGSVSIPSLACLAKDKIGLFVDQNGKLIQDSWIIWSDTHAYVLIHKPYAMARLPRHIEIRSLRAPSALVQTVVFVMFKSLFKLTTVYLLRYPTLSIV